MTAHYAPDEIDIDAPTRSARLKWVIVVNGSLSPGIATNAAVCVAAATAANVDGVLGPDGQDAAGNPYPGLPWAGCTILTASAEQLAALRSKADSSDDAFVSAMPSSAQTTRVYREYLDALSATDPERVELYAVSLLGPRNRVDRLVGRLSLL
jgi:hypothetical protein